MCSWKWCGVSTAEIIGTPSVSGSGNAVTGMTVSGDTVTLTKGTTFATKAQVLYLDNGFYVTEGISAYTAFYQQLAAALRGAA